MSDFDNAVDVTVPDGALPAVATTERDAIVAWLRDYAERSTRHTVSSCIHVVADAIERGEHLATPCSCGSAAPFTPEAGRDGWLGCPNCGMV